MRALPSAPSISTAVAIAGGLASGLLACYCLFQRRRQHGSGTLARLLQRWAMLPHSQSQEEGEGDEVPEDFLDPITFSAMVDPVLLCGTGQVYCLRSLRSWLATGSRMCPKTNITMRDVEVVRLPYLRARITAWHAQHGLPPPPPLDPPPEVLREAGAEVPQLLSELRCGDVYKRGVAAGAVNDLFIQWGTEEATSARQAVMEALLLDLVWLMRQGDSYGSAVAAAALSHYDTPEQMTYLAAVAAMPAVSLLWSPHAFGQHSAARLLAGLARAGAAMPGVLVEAGATRGLLLQLDLSVPFAYSRCSAAAALWGLCKCAAGRAEVRAGGGVRLLKLMVLQEEAEEQQEEPGPHSERLLRFDKRDAAGALLALHLTDAEAAEEPAVQLEALLRYKHCSHAWLRGQVGSPNEGYSEDELAAGLRELASGEEEDVTDEEDEAWEGGEGVEGEAEEEEDGEQQEGAEAAAGGEGGPAR